MLRRVGNTKVLAKEIKQVKAKSSGKVLLSSTYQIASKAITFRQQGNIKYDDYRTYTQNGKGVLLFSQKNVLIVKETSIEAVEYMGLPVQEAVKVTDNTVDVLAEYPGGMIAARTFIAQNLQYPALAQESNVQGTVFVTFVIAKDGSINNIKIDRGIGSGCDEEVIRVIKKMPKWIPAKLNGKNVNYSMRMPVSFKLTD